MEKSLLFDIIIQSWRLSFSKTKFLIFGFFMALPIASQFLLIPEGVADEEALASLIAAFPGYALLYCCCYVALTIIGKAGLIRSLSQTHDAPSREHALPTHSFRETLKRAFLIELGFGALLLGIILILVAPSALSYVVFQKVPEALAPLGLAVFLLMVITLFFIRQFSYYYFLLSPLQLQSSIERGIRLFIQHRLPSLVFGLLSVFMYGIFTLSLNLAMLGGVVLCVTLFGEKAEPLFSFLCSLFLLTWYTIFHQALWLHFFYHIAKPKNPPLPTQVVLKEEGLPEAPSI